VLLLGALAVSPPFYRRVVSIDLECCGSSYVRRFHGREVTISENITIFDGAPVAHWSASMGYGSQVMGVHDDPHGGETKHEILPRSHVHRRGWAEVVRDWFAGYSKREVKDGATRRGWPEVPEGEVKCRVGQVVKVSERGTPEAFLELNVGPLSEQERALGRLSALNGTLGGSSSVERLEDKNEYRQEPNYSANYREGRRVFREIVRIFGQPFGRIPYIPLYGYFVISGLAAALAAIGGWRAGFYGDRRYFLLSGLGCGLLLCEFGLIFWAVL